MSLSKIKTTVQCFIVFSNFLINISAPDDENYYKLNNLYSLFCLHDNCLLTCRLLVFDHICLHSIALVCQDYSMTDAETRLSVLSKNN